MELSDAERQKIYEEEKARMEIKDELKRKKKSYKWYWILGIIVLYIIVSTGKQMQNAGPTPEDIYQMGKKFVTERLKSPGSADFPSIIQAEIGRLDGTEDQYLVRSYVDSQNGFGALIRTKYEVIMRYDKSRLLWYFVSFKQL